MLASLVRELVGLGLGGAKQVLLTGTSAGGVAAMLQGDNVRAMLPTVEKFKIISFAGWFRTDASACKDATRCPWAKAMQHAVTMHSMRSNEDGEASENTLEEASCLREHGWRCMHAGLAARRVKTPLFVVQSALDSWSLANIWRGSDLERTPGDPEVRSDVTERGCIGSCFASCSTEETDDLNGSASACAPPPSSSPPPPRPQPITAAAPPPPLPAQTPTHVRAGFAAALVSDVSENLLSRAGNGAFVTNCCTHELHQLPQYELDTSHDNSAPLERRAWQLTTTAQVKSACGAGQRNADASQCLAAVVAATSGAANGHIKLVDNADVPPGCSYNRVSGGALFNSGAGQHGNENDNYQLVCKPASTGDGITMTEAIHRWWEAPSGAPASAHTYLPNCSLSTDAPGGCNPSCKTRQRACNGRAFAAIGSSLTAACKSDTTCLPNIDLAVRSQGV